MSLAARLAAVARGSAALLDPLQSLMALGFRLYVAWQFFSSGLVKIGDWEETLYLFTEEWHVPVLPPPVAAVAGTFGELFFPALLALGLWTRLGALGLSAVNVMAVVSYRQVLLSAGFEAALGQHVLWGTMLLAVIVYGPGLISIDALLARRSDSRPPRY